MGSRDINMRENDYEADLRRTILDTKLKAPDLIFYFSENIQYDFTQKILLIVEFLADYSCESRVRFSQNSSKFGSELPILSVFMSK